VASTGDVGFRVLILVLCLVAGAVIATGLLEGRAYYGAAYVDRPHMAEHRIFGASGTRGHGYGVVGAFLILVMQLYSLRKRTRRFERFGTPAQWLQVHICFGIIGPLLVILHSTFRVTGLVAVSFWSMVAVAASGVFGRYLYLQIPRNLAGQELSRQEIVALERELAERQAAEQRPHEMAKLARRRSRLEGRVRRLERVRKVFHWWHVVHKPFAIIMMMVMAVHIAVTVSLGYAWVF